MIDDRKDIPFLLNRLGLTGVGVEVGVQYGQFSEYVLRYSKLACLISVDSWKHYDKGYGNDSANVSQDEQEKVYAEACERLERFGDRSEVVRMESLKAAKRFDPGSLDFVYLDANHSYNAVKADIQAWFPLVKKGGVFAGHDYLTEERKKEVDREYYGVKQAVDELGLEVHITDENFPTWLIVK